MIRSLKQKVINNFLHFPTAIFWNVRFGYTSSKLKVIGVTGTDGKTTTSNMIYKILLDRGEKVGLISTISAKYNGKDLDTGFHVTSPNAKNLQRFLSMMISEGVKVVVLEVTSHGLDQYRFWGVKFDTIVYTNITHEHIDYHGTFENYLNAKLKLVDLLKNDGIIILNHNDNSYKSIIEYIRKNNGEDFIQKNVLSYGENLRTVKDNEIALTISNKNVSNFNLTFQADLKLLGDSQTKSYSVVIPILGQYNILNASAALLATNRKFIENENFDEAVNSLSKFDGLVGRMQILNKNPLIIVDFAHTPNALQNAIDTVKAITKGNILLVFGCAGLRDKGKRRMMGEIAAKQADQIYLVPEDPRTESLKGINDEIIQGINEFSGKLFGVGENLFRFDEPQVLSRIEGINLAIKNSKSEDTVIICGKGHEQSLCFGSTEYLYTDQETVINYINKIK